MKRSGSHATRGGVGAAGRGALVVAARGVVVLFAAFAAFAIPEPVQHVLQRATAAAVQPALTLAGIQATPRSSTELVLANHIFRFDFECTAFHVLVLFSAVILVTPVTWRRRLQALLIGVPVVCVANVARIVGVAAVSQAAPQHFYLMHGYTFQAFMVVFVAGFWAVWLHLSRFDWLPGWE